jgi:hypothetical protein
MRPTLARVVTLGQLTFRCGDLFPRRILVGLARRRCFVISAIGPEGSETRKHADDVFDYVVKPAMDACDIESVRADHLREPGLISDQMLGEIVNDDLCVAVLTGFNPNVFYELAMAQAAGRPVIILLEKGQLLPFDIKDLRCVYYDLDVRQIMERRYEQEIVEHIRSLEASDWQAKSPLAGIVPTPDRQAELLEKADDFGDHGTWLELLAGTKVEFDVLGIALSSWLRTEGFTDVLRAKAEAGCEVRILLPHSDGPMVEHLARHVFEPVDRDKTVAAIRSAETAFLRLDSSHPTIQLRRLRRGLIHYNLTRTDSSAVVIPYLHSMAPANSPAVRCTSTSPLYTRLKKDFEALWSLGEGASGGG